MIIDGAASTAASRDTENTRSSASKAKLDEDLNKFLTLLVTQLQNQDPLDPLDANEFTTQLVQFASVEQQIQQNSNLEKLVSIQSSSNVAAMVGFIGTTVEAAGNKVPLENSSAKFTYEFDETAQTVSISIMNSSDAVVFSTEGNTEAGQHTYTWNGLDNLGNQLSDGDYKINIMAKDRAGDQIETTTTVFGRVTAAGADGADVTIYLGDDIAVPMDTIKTVKETVAPQNAPQEDT